MASAPRFPAIFLDAHGSARAARGHRWIFSNEVEKADAAAKSGREVAVFSKDKEFLGCALYNKAALICARIYSGHTAAFDEALLRERIGAAFARRRRIYPGREAFRAVFSEGDGLPGLIVDKYGPVLSVQFLTLAMEERRGAILSILRELESPEAIVDRSDVSARTNEGLQERKEVAFGAVPEDFQVDIDGLKFRFDPMEGQKTGLYLDQADQWQLMRQFAPGRKVLDLFSYVGGFSVNAARYGATDVRAIDESELALSALLFNVQRNGLGHVRPKRSDATQYVRSLPETFDTIVCDPPPFARSRKQLEGAIRGYRDLNRWCMKMLNPGGVLITCSCSAAVGAEDFSKMLGMAAKDAGRTFRVLPAPGQPADHPPLLAMPETNYLKTMILEAAD